MSATTPTPTPTPSARRPLLLTIGIAAALLIALGIFLVACTGGDDPDPTPPPSPTPTETTPEPTPTETTPDDPVEAARQEAIDAAKARYTDFIAVRNEVDQAGGAGGYEAVLPFLGTPDLMQTYESIYAQWAEQQLRQTGERSVAAIKVTDLQGDPTAGQILIADLEICLDNTGVDVVNPAGESVLLEGYPARLLQDVRMQTQEDGRWTIIKNENTEQEC